MTELRLAGAGSIGEANRVLEQFLPRFNRRFRVPAQHPDPAFRPLDPDLCLEQVLCFKHSRRVAKRRGLSIRGMARELGIHRETVRRYIDAASPPARRLPAPTSDSIGE